MIKSRKQKWEDKQLYKYFKGQIKEIAQRMTRIKQQSGKLKRELESFIIAGQNSAKRTNYVTVKIDIKQENSKCTLFDDEPEVINHMINECK